MSTQTAPQGAETPQEPQGSTEASTQPQGTDKTGEPVQDPPQGGGTDWKAEAQKWEKRAKKDADALTKLRGQLQTAISPEQAELAQRTAEQATSDAATAQAEALRLRVALEKGIPPEFEPRLIGTTREELEKDAESLRAFIPGNRGVPAAKAGTGQREKPAEPERDINKLLRTMTGH